MRISTKSSGFVSSVISAISSGGSGASAVCQGTCSTTVGILPLLGVSLAATPFAIFADYQLYIWWLAFTFFIVLVLFYLINPQRSKVDYALIWINASLLIVGLPYFKEFNFIHFLPWIGFGFLLFGLYLFVRAKKIIIKFI